MISLKDWSVDVRSIRSTGHDLRRPECILAEPDGSLWVSDSRGGLTYISDAGQQHLVLQSRAAQLDRETQPDNGGDLQYGTLPNGLAFDAAGNILVANIRTDHLELTTRAGETRVLCDTIARATNGESQFRSSRQEEPVVDHCVNEDQSVGERDLHLAGRRVCGLAGR